MAVVTVEEAPQSVHLAGRLRLLALEARYDAIHQYTKVTDKVYNQNLI